MVMIIILKCVWAYVRVCERTYVCERMYVRVCDTLLPATLRWEFVWLLIDNWRLLKC